MSDRVADPKALGFAAFGFAAWMFSLANAGLYADPSVGTMLTVVASFSTIALLIAALASFLRGEAWYATFFMFWTAFMWGYKAVMGSAMGASAFGAWFDILVALVSLLLLMAALRISAGMPVILLSLAVVLSFLLSALGGWLGGGFLMTLSSWAGLAAGLAAFWATAGEIGRIGARPGASTAT
jgi:succinate-acetate transporter protein